MFCTLTTSGVIWGIVELLLFIAVATLEAEELITLSCCTMFDSILNIFRPPLLRFIFYLILNFTWGSAGVGAIWWIPSVCVVLLTIIYAILAFCGNKESSSQSAN